MSSQNSIVKTVDDAKKIVETLPQSFDYVWSNINSRVFMTKVLQLPCEEEKSIYASASPYLQLVRDNYTPVDVTTNPVVFKRDQSPTYQLPTNDAVDAMSQQNPPIAISFSVIRDIALLLPKRFLVDKNIPNMLDIVTQRHRTLNPDLYITGDYKNILQFLRIIYNHYTLGDTLANIVVFHRNIGSKSDIVKTISEFAITSIIKLNNQPHESRPIPIIADHQINDLKITIPRGDEIFGTQFKNIRGVYETLTGVWSGDKLYKIVESDLNNNTVFFNGYMQAMVACCQSGAGIVIKPSDIWFIIASQLAKHITANAEAYRQLFTTSDTKIGLVFVVPDPNQLDIGMIVKRLKTLINSKTVDLFTPEFSDSTLRTREATAACFCMAMETYYTYFTAKGAMKLFWPSSVRICGTKECWGKIAKHCIELSSILTLASGYLRNVAMFALSMADPTLDFCKELIHCDSGNGIYGSLQGLYSLNAEISNCTNISKFNEGASVTYTNSETNTVFVKTYIFAGGIVDGNTITVKQNYILLENIEKSPANVAAIKSSLRSI